jgi:RNA polymerase sigma-70 factor, ECF subfamily
MQETGSAGDEAGERLAAHESRLRLLLAHLAGRAVRARVELDDLIQEVYLRTLADARGLPPREPGERVLWRVLASHARHTVVDVARAMRAAKRDGVHEPLRRSSWSRGPAGLAAAEPGPATAAVVAESGRALARSYLELPPDHRRVLGLRQFEGLSARETAQRMGRSESAVHSLYRRALEAWQEHLRANRVSPDESAPFVRPDTP